MTVSTTISEEFHQGNGIARSWVNNFKAQSVSELTVKIVSVLGISTTLTPLTDFTASGLDTSMVTVTLTGGPATPAAGETIHIARVTSPVQDAAYPENDGFPAKTHEKILDRAYLLIQEMQRTLTKTLRVPDEADFNFELPNPATTVGGAFPRLNDTKTGLVWSDPSDFATIAASANWKRDTFSGDDATTVFVLTEEPGSGNAVLVYEDGVFIQAAAYSVAGTILTFDSPPATGTDNIEVVYTDILAAASQPGDGTVGTSALQDLAVTPAKTSGIPALAAVNTFTDRQIIQVSDNGAGGTIGLMLQRLSDSPAAGDLLQRLLFRGRNDAAEDLDYADIVPEIVSAADGAEAGRLHLRAAVGGVMTSLAQVGPGLVVGAPTGGDKGLGTANLAGDTYRNNVKIAGGEVLASQVLSATASPVSFQGIFAAGYKRFEIHLLNIHSSADNVALRLRFMRGASAVSTTSYHWASQANNIGGGFPDAGTYAHIPLTREVDSVSLGNQAGEVFNCKIELATPNNADSFKQCVFHSTISLASAPSRVPELFAGYAELRDAVTAVDGFQVLVDSGNLAGGEIVVVGYRF